MMEYDLEIEGSNIRVFQQNDYSEVPTIVFLHDSLGCIKLWRDFPTTLGKATNCNVLVYDRLGYGESGAFKATSRNNDYLEIEADFLHILLGKCSIKQAILFGHSDGGSIALIAAAKYPEKIVGIITEGAHIFVEEITLKGIHEAVKEYQTTLLPEKLSKYHGSKTDAVFQAWAETWLSESYRDWTIEHFLSQIKCPALIIQGENDEFGSFKQVEGIVNATQNKAVSLIIPACGHNPHKEAPDVTLQKSIEFIKNLN